MVCDTSCVRDRNRKRQGRKREIERDRERRKDWGHREIKMYNSKKDWSRS